MLTVTARLKRAPRAIREPAAWFLPGADASRWLDEITRWPVPAEHIRFYPVAASARAPGEPAGALAVPPRGTKIPGGSRAQPYGELRENFFIPTDALVDPPPDDAELAAMCLHPVMIFHPAHGLSGHDENTALRAWDFFAPPRARTEDWSHAVAASAPNDRLRMVRLAQTITLADVFGEESRDIGKNDPDDLPPAADEPGAGLPGALSRGATKAFAKILTALASLVPRAPNVPPNIVNRIENWAMRKLSGVARDIEQLRNREIHRLLKLLETNPDEGLRHAISLAAPGNRGRATPSAQLGRRSLDYNASRVSGGLASDAWHVPADVQASLARSYREMAQRELKLGRHRRAACIFAELLGDFSSAAQCLKQGRHFAEAALLYEERLRNPAAAAECLVEGGLLHEAIAIYEKLERHLDAANLYQRLGDRENECLMLERVIHEKLKARDIFAASQLIETRLADPERALGLLAGTWPAGHQALRCLEERFALLARMKDTARAKNLIVALKREHTPLPTLAQLTGVLARVAASPAPEELRHAAAEAVRAKASAGLTEHRLEPADELSVLRALIQLSPRDRLLSRDASRFHSARSKIVPTEKPTRPTANRRVALVEAGAFPLSGWVRRVVSDAECFHVVASAPDGALVLHRGVWSGIVAESVKWPGRGGNDGVPIILAPHATEVLIATAGGAPFHKRSFPGTNVFAFAGMADCATTPFWLPDDAVQAAASRSTYWVVRIVGARVILASYHGGDLVYSRDVTGELMAAGAGGSGTSLALNVQGGAGLVALGFGKHVLVMENQRQIRVINMDERVIGLVAAPGSLGGWLVLLGRGAKYLPADLSTQFAVDDSLEMPAAAFINDGMLVLANDTAGRLFRLSSDKAVEIGQFEFPRTQNIVAISATGRPDTFAIFKKEGVIWRWYLKY
ncbi:MAG: hypothetical protein LBM04_05535 [Opitutaceae bacterium]|jgi:tetratricopeptide (TPR) repeat protein|nr:hypothetical protein [Opitutaceae bacterium]